MGTWRIPLLHWANATGGTIWAFDEGGGLLLATNTGTLAGDFPATAVGIYLDGSGTPTDLGALPTGFTPASAYTFHWRTQCLLLTDEISMSFTAIADVINHAGPDGSALEIDSALTGCTVAVLQSIASSTVTATMDAGGVVVLVGDETDPGPNPDTLVYFNGTYEIVATARPISLPPLPIRTPIMQGGPRRGR